MIFRIAIFARTLAMPTLFVRIARRRTLGIALAIFQVPLVSFHTLTPVIFTMLTGEAEFRTAFALISRSCVKIIINNN